MTNPTQSPSKLALDALRAPQEWNLRPSTPNATSSSPDKSLSVQELFWAHGKELDPDTIDRELAEELQAKLSKRSREMLEDIAKSLSLTPEQVPAYLVNECNPLVYFSSATFSELSCHDRILLAKRISPHALSYATQRMSELPPELLIALRSSERFLEFLLLPSDSIKEMCSQPDFSQLKKWVRFYPQSPRHSVVREVTAATNGHPPSEELVNLSLEELVELCQGKGRITTEVEAIFYERLAETLKQTALMVARKNAANMLGSEELIGVWSEVLEETVAKFDSSKGSSFHIYFCNRLRGAMLDQLRALDSLKRVPRARLKIIDAARSNLRLQGNFAPLDDELFDEAVSIQRKQFIRRKSKSFESEEERPPTPDEVGVLLREFQPMPRDSFNDLLRKRSLPPMSLDQDVVSKNGKERPLWSITPSGKIGDNPSARFDQQDLWQAIEEFVLPAFSPTERKIFLLYHKDGINLAQIGLLMGKSESRMSQILASLEQRAKENLSLHGEAPHRATVSKREQGESVAPTRAETDESSRNDSSSSSPGEKGPGGNALRDNGSGDNGLEDNSPTAPTFFIDLQ